MKNQIKIISKSKEIKVLPGHNPCKENEHVFIEQSFFSGYKYTCTKCHLLKK